MIKMTKIEKPSVLHENADKWRDLFLAYKAGDESVSSTIQNKYTHKEIKEAIIKETNGKCVYCESKILHVSFGDIEHILPKSELPEKCFEWSNLTLACTICNNKKRDYYDEQNLLVDPYIDDPDEHLYYAGPIIVNLTDRGSLTKLKIDLNRPELMENRIKHLKDLDGFIMQIQNTSYQDLRNALLADLRKKADRAEEYSKMTKDFLHIFEGKISEIIA